MKNRIKSGLITALAGVLTASGCYSSKPRIVLNYEQTTLRHTDENIRIGIEPIDTPHESKRAFNYDVNQKGYMPIFVSLENLTQDKEILFDESNVRLQENSGKEWSRANVKLMAYACAKDEMEAKAFATGASLGILVLPFLSNIEKNAKAELEKRFADYENQMFPQGQKTLYPGAVMNGMILFETPKREKSLLDTSKIIFPYSINDEKITQTFHPHSQNHLTKK